MGSLRTCISKRLGKLQIYLKRFDIEGLTDLQKKTLVLQEQHLMNTGLPCGFNSILPPFLPSLSFMLRMKAKLATMITDLEQSNSGIEKHYSDGIIDGFDSKRGPYTFNHSVLQ